jgi:hypothetical protein
VLSLVAVGTAIGGFGGPAAAAGLPPTLEGVSETFEPIDPNATPEPEASEPPIEPSAGDPSETLPGGPSLEPSVGPSFEPVPTG